MHWNYIQLSLYYTEISEGLQWQWINFLKKKQYTSYIQLSIDYTEISAGSKWQWIKFSKKNLRIFLGNLLVTKISNSLLLVLRETLSETRAFLFFRVPCFAPLTCVIISIFWSRQVWWGPDFLCFLGNLGNSFRTLHFIPNFWRLNINLYCTEAIYNYHYITLKHPRARSGNGIIFWKKTIYKLYTIINWLHWNIWGLERAMDQIFDEKPKNILGNLLVTKVSNRLFLVLRETLSETRDFLFFRVPCFAPLTCVIISMFLKSPGFSQNPMELYTSYIQLSTDYTETSEASNGQWIKFSKKNLRIF